VHDSTNVNDIAEEDKSSDSSIDVIAISSEVLNKIDQAQLQFLNNEPKSHITSVIDGSKTNILTKTSKNTDRTHTITPEVNQNNTSLPTINTVSTTRNVKKALVSHNRIHRKANALGKPPLGLDPEKKESIYPDALNYKHGTANNKILQLREHLTRNGTNSESLLNVSDSKSQFSKERANGHTVFYLNKAKKK